jgi:hypothetical protein
VFSQRATRANAQAQSITCEPRRSHTVAAAKLFALVTELWKLG